jgi:hypothetical protein
VLFSAPSPKIVRNKFAKAQAPSPAHEARALPRWDQLPIKLTLSATLSPPILV